MRLTAYAIYFTRVQLFANMENSTMAETTKLPVGQVLDKLRSPDVPKSKITRLDEKIETLDQETQRLRAARHRLERDQRAGSTGRD